MLCDDDDMGFGILFSDQPRRFQAVQTGHADVQNNDIRPKGLALFHGVNAIHGFAADLPLRGRLKQGSKPAAKDLVIVHDQDPRILPVTRLQGCLCDSKTRIDSLSLLVLRPIGYAGSEYQSHKWGSNLKWKINLQFA